MQPKEYLEKAVTTIKPHTTKEMAIADWALGICGEAGEVLEVVASNYPVQNIDMIDLAKEMGDVLWYIFAMSKEMDIDMVKEDLWRNSGAHSSALVQASKMSIAASKVAELCKHIIMHKESNKLGMLPDALEEVLVELTNLTDGFGISIKDVAELNVAKLTHRYHNKAFDFKASAERHAREEKFEDTPVYKEITARILATRN